ncbi:AprI/Inh family metalloprotease inhibitor [Salinarimonas soli]|uniref:Alkaline proteinase inhibitor/ Outer membrane lipoprotein Omp19 domain-containing protein n=1 Tax=Salinarimonas soli TaxID=1638099 RepID=A0A5B2VEU8_9HYPH|nr:AprI/Inh family metalloprotease inhibitor [Salinarimonas soli]KAA2236839.1 hypothetical protein F0L46_12665 [Salinarimonas soli]
MRHAWKPVTALILVAALPACVSARLGGSPPRAVAAVPQAGAGYSEPTALEPAPAAPAGSVLAEPLPPPPGSQVAAVDTGVPAAGGPVIADVPPTPAAPPAQVAAINPVPAAPSGPSRSSVLGGWNAREATGSSCRVTLSSSPALDLYRASTVNCQNKDLARVSAWDFRDGEVYLYQPGGTVAARLRSGGGALEGALTKSGAPLTLAR